MKEDLHKLYPDFIKAHHERPFHFEKHEELPGRIKVNNPVCGDKFELFVDIKGDNLDHLYFHGFGCAVSKASASVLTQLLEGKSCREAWTLCDQFLRFLRKELKEQELLLSKDFEAFSGVHDFPGRFDCAALAWVEMKKFLELKLVK